MSTVAKEADLAGPGPGDYAELARVLPDDYEPLLGPRETMEALYDAKRVIEDGLCSALDLTMVQVPLIVDRESGVNDYLDRDGSRTPVAFHIANDGDLHPIDAEVVQAATKWKRLALRQFGMEPGEGLLTDMRAVRKDYFLDHDHSAYVDQWDWEGAIRPADRTLAYLTETGGAIWRVLKDAEAYLLEHHPCARRGDIRRFLTSSLFLHAEDVLPPIPDLPRKQRRRRSSRTILQSSSTGSAGRSPTGTRTSCAPPTTTTGRPRRSRSTEADARPERGHPGLEPGHAPPARADVGRHPGDEGGARPPAPPVRAARLLGLPYHRAISRPDPALDRRGHRAVAGDDAAPAQAHLGEVSVTVWPEVLKELCEERNIRVLE